MLPEKCDNKNAHSYFYLNNYTLCILDILEMSLEYSLLVNCVSDSLFRT